MSHPIRTLLQPVRWRQQAVAVVHWAVWGWMAGGMLAAAVAAMRLSGPGDGSRAIGWLALVVTPFVIAAASALRCLTQRDELPAARAVDRHYEWKDRVETALAFLRRRQSGSAGEVEELQLLDATRHLQSVQPGRVVPWKLPRAGRWAALTTFVAIGLLCWPLPRQDVNAGPNVAVAEIVAEAEQVADGVKALAEQLPAEHDPEIDALIQELLAKAEQMQQSGVDVREALAKLSEMQSALQSLAAQLNPAAVDEELKSLGEALQSTKPLEAAGQALQKGEFNQAADELSKFADQAPSLDRKEQRALSDKLQKSSTRAAEKGFKPLSEAARQMAQGIETENAAQLQSGLKQLGEQAQKQAQKKQIAGLLKRETDKLAESKGNIQNLGQSRKPGHQLAKTSSRQAGKGAHAQVQGARTDFAATSLRQNITGQKGEHGDSEKETLATEESNASAQRGYQDVYQKYRKLSEAVLEAEDIPLGHRQTIRRYFEAIRPTRDDGAGDRSKAQ